MLVENERWANEIMGQKMLAEFCVMSLTPYPRVIVSNMPGESDRDILQSDNFFEEILDYAYSYTEKTVLIEHDGVMWGFVPSIFPSTSLVILLKFCISPKLVLALIKECGVENIFELSEKIKSHPSREREKVRFYKNDFLVLCERLHGVFGNSSRLNMCFERDELKNELVQQFIRIASLVGCPISVDLDDTDTEITPTYNNVDLALFTSFVFTMLCFARVNGKDRSAFLELKLLCWSPAVVIKIIPESGDTGDLINADLFAEWEKVISEKHMPFGVFESNGRIEIGFQPHRVEISYLDMKARWDIE